MCMGDGKEETKTTRGIHALPNFSPVPLYLPFSPITTHVYNSVNWLVIQCVTLIFLSVYPF